VLAHPPWQWRERGRGRNLCPETRPEHRKVTAAPTTTGLTHLLRLHHSRELWFWDCIHVPCALSGRKSSQPVCPSAPEHTNTRHHPPACLRICASLLRSTAAHRLPIHSDLIQDSRSIHPFPIPDWMRKDRPVAGIGIDQLELRAPDRSSRFLAPSLDWGICSAEVSKPSTHTHQPPPPHLMKRTRLRRSTT